MTARDHPAAREVHEAQVPHDGPAPPASDASARAAELAGSEPGSAAAPVLVHTARAADAKVLCEALREGGMSARRVQAPREIADGIEGAGCLLIAQEGLTPAVMTVVGRALADQPAWSELPVLVLAEGRSDIFALRAALDLEWGEAQVTFLTRPVAPLVLLTSVHAALSARLRQFLLRDQFAQETELRRELNHRVKNILVTVQAMAKMTQRAGAADGDRFEAFQSRLAALGAVHAMLFDTPDDAMWFQTVARTILGPFGVLDGDRVRIVGPGRPLKPEAAKILALCLQELVTNAVKYGALSGEAGRVEVSLEIRGEPGARHARLAWRESGGPEVRPPERRGYGTRYVTVALSGLFGAPAEPLYEPGGLRLEVEGPGDPLVA